ncbi:MAG TPA: aminotransferase class IV [Isosphaeraceae bacterium]|jgi:branched-subunit amino acid aminotransferase/4-amino-4-deoxychorismate lyase|nr:aminotransferase class IV [Isosphaeraceae bacterium]
MIWAAGQVMAEPMLTVSIADRTFEHGLGLFETLRTWSREPVLLARHMARLMNSAQQLGVPVDPAILPTTAAVAELLYAQGIKGDALLRITLTGGLSASAGSVAWMRAGPLPPSPQGGATMLGFWTIAHDDPLARHKTLNYWRRRLAFEQAQAVGSDEFLARTPDGLVWEGSRTNLFAVFGQRVETPPLSGPIVPGVMRKLVLEKAAGLGLKVGERPLHEDELSQADEVFLTNGVRGILPVARLMTTGQSSKAEAGGERPPESSEARQSIDGPRLIKEWPAPGSCTDMIWNDVLSALHRGGPV